jgi:AcrR family transcriptional regulator
MTILAEESLQTNYKARKQLKRRNEILDAAAEVFAEKGYHAATTKDIADRLGMRPGSLYYYFESKEAALYEVCRIASQEVVESMAELLEGDLNGVQLVQAAVELHMHPDRQVYVGCFAQNRHFLPPDARRETKATLQRYFAMWEEVFRRAIRDGAVDHKILPSFAAHMVLVLLNGSIPGLVRRPPKETGRFTAEVFRTLMQGMAPRFA